MKKILIFVAEQWNVWILLDLTGMLFDIYINIINFIDIIYVLSKYKVIYIYIYNYTCILNI